MPKNFIHYLIREITSRIPKEINHPFYADIQNLADGFERPLFHITRRSTGPVTKIEKGSIIWLFSTLKSPWGKFPPSLDAKIIVERIEYLSDGRIKFFSTDKSKWYPLNDATKLIDNLITVDNKGNEKKLRQNNEKSIGIYLQSIRELGDVDALIQWSENVLNSEYDFISYRIKDGTKLAFLKANKLIESGKIVFWDRYCLPRRLAERREIVDSIILDKYLMEKLENSSKVWGIETNYYSEEGSYSSKEALFAKKLNKYCPISMVSTIANRVDCPANRI
jgi:hypothetical protein